MSYLTLTGGEGGFVWRIDGLNHTFDQEWYISAGITTSFTYDTSQTDNSIIIGPIIDYETAAPVAYGTEYVSGRVDPYPAGTYYFYGYAQAANGKYYLVGDGEPSVISITSSGGGNEGGGTTTSYTLEIYKDDGIGCIDLYIEEIFSEAITTYTTRTFTTPTTVSVTAWNGSRQFSQWNVTANGSTIPYRNNPLEYLVTANTIIQAVSAVAEFQYNITVYCNDSNSAITQITCSNLNTSQSMTVTPQLYSNFLQNCTGNSILNAYVQDGYAISGWYVNGVKVADAVSTYTYVPDGTQEVNIIVETTTTAKEWIRDYEFDNYITYKEISNKYFPGYQVFLYEFQAGDTGTLAISTSGNIDATMYLSYSKEWNTSDGMPASWFLQGNTILITDVTTVGQVYYLWVHPNSATATGNLTITLRIYSAILNDFAAKQIDQTTSVTCSWNISNMSSGTTVQIRSSEKEPSNSMTDGTLRYEGYSLYTSSCTINVQQYGTQYIWINLYSNGVYKNSITRIVMLKPAPPKSWEWTATENAAFTGQGPITTLTRDRWNQFIVKINECISYSDTYNGSSIGTINESYKMQSDKIMYADSFSQICQKLNSLCSRNGVSGCGVSQVSKGDTIYGSYFVSMASALNRAINKLL